MQRTCLITGGAGFIGSAITPALADVFDRVVLVDSLLPQVHPGALPPAILDARAELVIADVADPETWQQLVPELRPSVVLHLAAETGTGQSLTEASRHARSNVLGLTELLDALSRHEVRPERILLPSSRAVYGEGAWLDEAGVAVSPGQRSAAQLARGEWDFAGLRPAPLRAATVQPAPASIYGATKLAQEHLLRAWALAQQDVTPIVLRLQNVYGPGQSLSNPYTGVVSLFARLAREGRPIPVYEDGEIVRDFVFIDDVAAAIVRAVTGPLPGSGPFDVGAGRPTTILQLAELIAARYDAPSPTVTGQYRQGDVRHAYAIIDDTIAAFDWRPRVSLEDGLERLCAWVDQELSDA